MICDRQNLNFDVQSVVILWQYVKKIVEERLRNAAKCVGVKVRNLAWYCLLLRLMWLVSGRAARLQHRRQDGVKRLAAWQAAILCETPRI